MHCLPQARLGSPVVLRLVAFSTSFVTNYDEKTVNRFIDGMQEHEYSSSRLPFRLLFGCVNSSGSTFCGISAIFPIQGDV
jgi:hypothetical protein